MNGILKLGFVLLSATALPSATVPSGTVFHVRLDQTLDTRQNRPGDRFYATLVHPVGVNEIIVPAGTRFTGHLIDSKPSGRFKGRAVLSLRLDSFQFNGHTYALDTSRSARVSKGHKGRDLILVGGGAGTGAAFGALAGPAGAAIGAGAGAAAGATGAVLTGKKNLRLPVESPLAFTLRSPVMVENR